MSGSSKKRSPKSTHRRLFIALPIIIAVIVLAGIGGYLWHRHRVQTANAANQHTVQPENTVNYKPAPAADNNANNGRKTSPNPAATLDNGPAASTPPATFTVAITNASVNGSNLHVGTLVNGTTSGTCTLTASQSGQSNIQLASSSVAQDVNAYDCGVFNISTQKFPAKGSWKLTLTVTSNGSTASDETNVSV